MTTDMTTNQKLSDCRKKCEDFGRKINELAHENKRLRQTVRTLTAELAEAVDIIRRKP